MHPRFPRFRSPRALARWGLLLAWAVAVAPPPPAHAYDWPLQWVPPATTARGAPAPLTGWHWDPRIPGVVFTFAGHPRHWAYSFPTGQEPCAPPHGYGAIAAQWGGLDNPAPLRWYAHHVQESPPLGWWVFGPGPTQHTPIPPRLVAVMNREHFAPSLIGGYNVPGLTTRGARYAPPACPPIVPPPPPPWPWSLRLIATGIAAVGALILWRAGSSRAS